MSKIDANDAQLSFHTNAWVINRAFMSPHVPRKQLKCDFLIFSSYSLNFFIFQLSSCLMLGDFIYCRFATCQFPYCYLGNCDINFLNFRHCQVWNFEISNLYEQNQNVGVIFWKYQKQNRKSTKYFETSQKPSVIPLKFCKMSFVSWNLINYCKILQFLVKFFKRPKDFRKILLKWLGKTVRYCLNFVNFPSRTEKWLKAGQLSSITLMTVYDIPQRFFES